MKMCDDGKHFPPNATNLWGELRVGLLIERLKDVVRGPLLSPHGMNGCVGRA